MNPHDHALMTSGMAKLMAGAALTLTEAEREVLAFYGSNKTAELYKNALTTPDPAPAPAPAKTPSRPVTLKVVKAAFKSYHTALVDVLQKKYGQQIEDLQSRLQQSEAAVADLQSKNAVLESQVLELRADLATKAMVGL